MAGKERLTGGLVGAVGMALCVAVGNRVLAAVEAKRGAHLKKQVRDIDTCFEAFLEEPTGKKCPECGQSTRLVPVRLSDLLEQEANAPELGIQPKEVTMCG